MQSGVGYNPSNYSYTMGVLNVCGSGQLTVSSGGIILGSPISCSWGIANIGSKDNPGGSITAPNLQGGQVNFHGGTLHAVQDDPNFLTATTYIYSEGATIDTNGHNVTANERSARPPGSGILSIPVTNQGSGYFGARPC